MVKRRPLWILGQGGFLGSAIAEKAQMHGYDLYVSERVPWLNSAARAAAIEDSALAFADFAANDRPTIIWAAGAEGVATQFHEDSTELATFTDLVSTLRATTALYGSRVIVCSSAGGVYSGSMEPPYSINSPTNAINDYGRGKIAVEQMTANELAPYYSTHIARISNLYGPWPGPRQGLINRLCTAAATREPVKIYVSLETVRDYIYVTDAAELLLGEQELLEHTGETNSPSVSLIGSGIHTSIGAVIKYVANVTHRKVPVTISELEATRMQPRDLRVLPSWIERGIEFSPVTPPQGIKRVFDSLVTVPRWV